jgi:hypothetical protein
MATAAAVCRALCCACRQLATGKHGGRPLLTGQQQVGAAAHESAAQRHLFHVECMWRWMMMVVLSWRVGRSCFGVVTHGVLPYMVTDSVRRLSGTAARPVASNPGLHNCSCVCCTCKRLSLAVWQDAYCCNEGSNAACGSSSGSSSRKFRHILNLKSSIKASCCINCLSPRAESVIQSINTLPVGLTCRQVWQRSGNSTQMWATYKSYIVPKKAQLARQPTGCRCLAR